MAKWDGFFWGGGATFGLGVDRRQDGKCIHMISSHL